MNDNHTAQFPFGSRMDATFNQFFGSLASAPVKIDPFIWGDVASHIRSHLLSGHAWSPALKFIAVLSHYEAIPRFCYVRFWHLCGRFTMDSFVVGKLAHSLHGLFEKLFVIVRGHAIQGYRNFYTRASDSTLNRIGSAAWAKDYF